MTKKATKSTNEAEARLAAAQEKLANADDGIEAARSALSESEAALAVAERRFADSGEGWETVETATRTRAQAEVRLRQAIIRRDECARDLEAAAAATKADRHAELAAAASATALRARVEPIAKELIELLSEAEARVRALLDADEEHRALVRRANALGAEIGRPSVEGVPEGWIRGFSMHLRGWHTLSRPVAQFLELGVPPGVTEDAWRAEVIELVGAEHLSHQLQIRANRPGHQDPAFVAAAIDGRDAALAFVEREEAALAAEVRRRRALTDQQHEAL